MSPPTFDDENQTRRARLLRTVLLVFGAVMMVGVPLLLVVNGLPETFIEGITIIFACVLLLLSVWLFFLLRRGRVVLAGAIFVSVLWVLITAYIWAISGLLSDGTAFIYPLIIVLSGLLLGGNAAIVFMLLSGCAVAGAVLIETLGLVSYPMTSISWSMVVVLFSTFLLIGLLLRSAMSSLNVALERAQTNERAQIEANRQLEIIRASLEDRVAERTGVLQQRARQLEVALEVGRVAASIRNMEELFSKVTALIAERLDFYHVGIFMIDEPSGEGGLRYAVLRASNSEGGKLMLARGHRLVVGQLNAQESEGIVGHVAETGTPRIALDVGSDEVYFNNPLLPYTRSEIALPLVSGDRALGVLDVQSSKRDAFSQEDVAVLQVLADQLAVAIENAELFAQSQEALEAQRRAYGEISRQAWREAIGSQGDIGYVCSAYGVLGAADEWKPEMIQAYSQRQTIQADGATLALPIDIRDNVEGVVRLCKENDADVWTQDEIELMQSLTDQLSLALDSARLYQETQLRAAYQQQLSEVTSHIRQTLDIETVLRTAAEQVREALGLPEVVVQLTNPVQDRKRDEPLAETEGT
ncbi:MAG: GAF domain-containing protein [Anaerolineae bacterium]|nr:GAF domain-containing protein [Anaerolineae bacterium]